MKFIVNISELRKSFSSELSSKHPDGKWITSNGSHLFIKEGKDGSKRVIAGLGGFNGLIDEYFANERTETRSASNVEPKNGKDSKFGASDKDRKGNKKVNKLEKLKNEYEGKNVDELVKLKKKLYSNVDIELPKSNEEKLLDKIIADKFSEINENIKQKRKLEKEQTKITDKTESKIKELDNLKDSLRKLKKNRKWGGKKTEKDKKLDSEIYKKEREIATLEKEINLENKDVFDKIEVKSKENKEQSKKDTEKINSDFEKRQKDLDVNLTEDEKVEAKVTDIMNNLENDGKISQKEVDYLNENSFVPNGWEYGDEGLRKTGETEEVDIEKWSNKDIDQVIEEIKPKINKFDIYEELEKTHPEEVKRLNANFDKMPGDKAQKIFDEMYEKYYPEIKNDNKKEKLRNKLQEKLQEYGMAYRNEPDDIVSALKEFKRFKEYQKKPDSFFTNELMNVNERTLKNIITMSNNKYSMDKKHPEYIEHQKRIARLSQNILDAGKSTDIKVGDIVFDENDPSTLKSTGDKVIKINPKSIIVETPYGEGKISKASAYKHNNPDKKSQAEENLKKTHSKVSDKMVEKETKRLEQQEKEKLTPEEENYYKEHKKEITDIMMDNPIDSLKSIIEGHKKENTKEKQLTIDQIEKKALEIAPGKPVNERSNEEVYRAKEIINNAMPKKMADMTWDEYKPYGIAKAKQSSHSQPDSYYERNAKWEFDWAQDKKKKDNELITDPHDIQEYKNSIREGELMLQAGKSNGKKLSKDQIFSVQRSIDNSKRKIGLIKGIKFIINKSLIPHKQLFQQQNKERVISDIGKQDADYMTGITKTLEGMGISPENSKQMGILPPNELSMIKSFMEHLKKSRDVKEAIRLSGINQTAFSKIKSLL